MNDIAGKQLLPRRSIPTVGIAASAGGLQPLRELVEMLPAAGGMAYVIVTHLAPDHDSLLAPILAKSTALPVVQAENDLELTPDHIFVTAPGTVVTVESHKFRVVPRETGPSPHAPVNALFKSIARSCDLPIGVILSGTGTDGAEGVKAIKEAAGVVLIQDESSAHRGMPDSALQTGCVDRVLTPRAIGEQLASIAKHVPSRQPAENTVDDEKSVVSEDALGGVFRILLVKHKSDFTQYKRSTVERRLRRRMALRRVQTIPSYVALLAQDAAEVAALHDDLLIRVTSFFRDPATYQVLSEKVFPAICDRRTRNKPIRIWVAGCATGEELYSIAIVLLEYLGDRAREIPLQFFGTDLSEAAITQARVARYPAIIADQVSSARLERFFERDHNAYKIATSVRQMCLFARHDVARDPAFPRIDLVSCCNVLIYMNANMQRHVLRNFHYALKPEGFLRLGPAESVAASAPYFQRAAEQQFNLYARQALPRAQVGRDTTVARLVVTPPTDAAATELHARAPAFQSAADTVLLQRFAPPAIVVDDQMNVIRFWGATGDFIEHSSGTASLNLHKLARPSVLVPLLTAIRDALESGERSLRRNIHVETGRSSRDVDLEVVPLSDAATGRRAVLVLFDQKAGSGVVADRMSALPDSEKDRRIGQMHRELADARVYVEAMAGVHQTAHDEAQTAVEDLLSANEELQSTNAELASTREALQSTSEELETTNEELLHRAEELQTLNQEVQHRRADAEFAQRYADAMIETVAHPMLVLDADLIVRQANRSFFETFRTSEADTLQKPVFDIGSGQWNIDALRSLLSDVLTANEPIVNYTISHDFPSLGRRVMRFGANRIAGDEERKAQILLAIEDITDPRAGP